MGFWKGLKHVLVALACLIIINSFASGLTATVQAPVPEPIIMWAVATPDPYWGYYGGYHQALYEIRDELVKIGIDLRIKMFEPEKWWRIPWEDKWNVPGDADGDPETYTYGIDGWDFFASECDWLNPTSYTRLGELFYSWMVYPSGWNIMPWLDEKADSLLDGALTTVDPVEHKKWMWLWQERFMHNPPVLVMYYPEIMTADAAYVGGWDPVAWFYDVSHLTVDVDVFDSVAPSERKAIGSDTLIYGVVEPVWNFNPLFVSTETQGIMNLLTHDTLYALSRDPWPDGQFVMRPDLAAGFPTWHTCSELGYTYEEDYPVARVPIREDVTWSDGVPFNATDVAFTFNTILYLGPRPILNLGPIPFCPSVPPLLREAVVVNETCVDFILWEQRFDITTVFGETMVSIIPWHTLKDIASYLLREHPTNCNWTQYLPGTGPFVLEEFVHGDHITLTKNPSYFGYELGWGPYSVDKIILKLVPDPPERLIALINSEVDFCEYSPAPIRTWEAIESRETHNVYTYPVPASDALWMNLDNPILSNRYVRLAIAHTIPYDRIYTEILPGWGISKPYRGKTFVTPWHESFAPDTVLEPYTYDIDVAKKYMNMWRYSQVDTDYTKGPVGDADFDGFVGPYDFTIWNDNYGEYMPIPRLPGQDIDPDNDNTGYVETADFYRMREHLGEYYPFAGAR